MNEQAMRLLTLLSDVDEEYADADKKPSSVMRVNVLLSAVACVAVIAMGVFLWYGHGDTPSPETPEVVPNETVTQPTEQEESSLSKITFIHPTACYAEGPDVGEAFVEIPFSLLEQSVAENEETLISIYLRDETGKPVLHSEEVYEEMDRLESLGLDLYVYEEYGTDYWGAPKHITHICAYVTVEELKQFPVGDRFAYVITDYRSSVPIEEFTQY